MGIPIGWNIAREDAKQKDVLRADVTGHRSPIRRRTRLLRSPRSQSAFDADLLASAARYSSHPEPPVARHSHARTRLPPPPVPEVSRSADVVALQRHGSDLVRQLHQIERDARALEADAQHRDSEETRRAMIHHMRNARSEIEQQLSRNSLAQHMLRESGQAGEVEDEHDNGHGNAVSLPPLRRMGRRNVADGPLPVSSLRESWSPATTVDGLGDRERSLGPEDESLHWDSFHEGIIPDTMAPTAESSFTSAAASASFSNSHPSSRAGSANTSASSSRTHLTIPPQLQSPPTNEQFMRACDTSDDDTASDTEVDEETPAGDAIRRRNNPAISRRRGRPLSGSEDPPHRDVAQYSRQVMQHSINATAYIHDYYSARLPRRRSLRGIYGSLSRSPSVRGRVVDGPRMEQLDGPVDGPHIASDEDISPLIPINSPALDHELHEARSLLEQLSRREDVSDDLWASAGLTRSFAGRIESFNEREQQ